MNSCFLVWLWDKEHPRRIFEFGQIIDIQTVGYVGRYAVMGWMRGSYLIRKTDNTKECLWLHSDLTLTKSLKDGK